VLTAALMLHLYPGVPVRVTLHPQENRAVVAVGTGTLLLDLFCDRAELVALRDALIAAVGDLDTAACSIDTAACSIDTAAGKGTGPEQVVPPDEVSSPAA
jgi:hypothetical protein